MLALGQNTAQHHLAAGFAVAAGDADACEAGHFTQHSCRIIHKTLIACILNRLTIGGGQQHGQRQQPGQQRHYHISSRCPQPPLGPSRITRQRAHYPRRQCHNPPRHQRRRIQPLGTGCPHQSLLYRGAMPENIDRQRQQGMHPNKGPCGAQQERRRQQYRNQRPTDKFLPQPAFQPAPITLRPIAGLLCHVHQINQPPGKIHQP